MRIIISYVIYKFHFYIKSFTRDLILKNFNTKAILYAEKFQKQQSRYLNLNDQESHKILPSPSEVHSETQHRQSEKRNAIDTVSKSEFGRLLRRVH